jgi:hypothetical protein
MFRVEELKDGVWLVLKGEDTKFVIVGETLDESVREKICLLKAADIHVRIAGVGTRIAENVYWIAEGDDASDMDADSCLFLENVWRTVIKKGRLLEDMPRAFLQYDLYTHTYRIVINV